MKKSVLIAVIAVAAVVAIICGVVFLGGNNVPKVEVADSADVLNKVVSTYTEDEKFFAMGGDMTNPVDNAAGIYSLEDKEGMVATLHISEELIADIDEAGSFMHAMNANTFTSAAFRLTDAAKAETFSSALKENIRSTQWMCGFPEKLVMYTINGGEYVVYAIGTTDLIDNFTDKLVAVYSEAAVETVNEAIV